MASVTKPGKHGTLYLFRVTYEDAGDPGFGRDAVRLWAYDAEHAIDRFHDYDDDPDWRIVSVTKATR
jgi:hypothetical protein